MSFYRIVGEFIAPWCNDDFYKLQTVGVYEALIRMDTFRGSQEPILLEVRNQDEANDRKYWEYRDFFVWKRGSPSAYILVVSTKMKKTIEENLSIPPHKYYNCIIENYKTGESSTDYFVLHFIHDYYEEIDYQRSKFGIINIVEEELISEIPFSVANNKSNILAEEQAQWAKEWTNGVKPLRLVLTKEYDIIGVNNFIYVSPKARQVFLDNNLSGIDFIPYTTGKISSTTVPEIVYQNEE